MGLDRMRERERERTKHGFGVKTNGKNKCLLEPHILYVHEVKHLFSLYLSVCVRAILFAKWYT